MLVLSHTCFLSATLVHHTLVPMQAAMGKFSNGKEGAPEVPAGAAPSVGSVAEKLAQFLANLYHLVRGCSCVVCGVGVTNIL